MGKRVDDLERNDVPGAVAVYRAGLSAGTWTPEQAEMILMLQDDPSKLRAEIAGVNVEMHEAFGRYLRRASG